MRKIALKIVRVSANLKHFGVRKMNQTGHAYSKCFLVAMLVGGFLIFSEMPLLASPQQSSQPGTPAQKQDDSLPDAPQSQAAQTQSAPAPSGAAGAKAANVKGAPVAQPAGAAVAPVRQRGHRSLLIKVAVIAGAGIAIGSLVVLSERSPSRPPGASPAVHP
jgi:predicted lipid-binding transport protein (Tim44 family)